ncbi:MAG: hypothetical protein ACFFD4_18475 [Candidatus Odinarchaeota archaeon]
MTDSLPEESKPLVDRVAGNPFIIGSLLLMCVSSLLSFILPATLSLGMIPGAFQTFLGTIVSTTYIVYIKRNVRDSLKTVLAVVFLGGVITSFFISFIMYLVFWALYTYISLPDYFVAEVSLSLPLSVGACVITFSVIYVGQITRSNLRKKE